MHRVAPASRVCLQVFQCHYMRYLYTLFGEQPPKYILDAGGCTCAALLGLGSVFPSRAASHAALHVRLTGANAGHYSCLSNLPCVACCRRLLWH